jgi:hypothetical protein
VTPSLPQHPSAVADVARDPETGIVICRRRRRRRSVFVNGVSSEMTRDAAQVNL